MKLEVETIVETAQSEDKVDKLTQSIEALTKVQTEALEDQKKLAEQGEKAAASGTKGTKRWSMAFKGLGNAIKLAGVGLLLGIVASLSEAFQQNQVIVDKVNTIFNAFSKTVNDFVDFMMSGNVLDTITGFFGALIDNPAETLQGVTKSMKEYGEETIKTAAAAVELEKNSRIAAAEQQRLIEQYDRQAEQQRQIRDDESKTIDERVEANEKLGKILDDQIAAETKLINQRIKAAELAVETNNNIDNRVALIEAQTEKDALLARVEGFRSEQLINRVSLEKELNEELFKRQMLEDTEDIGAIESAGASDMTPEQEIKVKQEEFMLEKMKEANDKFNAEREAADQEAAKQKEFLDAMRVQANVSTISTGLAVVQGLFEENTQGAKFAAAAQATFDTYAAIAGQLKAYSGIPVPGFAIAQAIATGAFGLLQVKKILSTNTKSPSAPTLGAAPRGGASIPRQGEEDNRAPNFESLNFGVGGQQGAGFGSVRAVVINSQFKNQQKVDARVQDLLSNG